MLAEIMKTALKNIDTLFQNSSKKYAFPDSFSLSSIRFARPSTKFDSRVAMYKSNNVDEDIDCRKVARKFGNV